MSRLACGCGAGLTRAMDVAVFSCGRREHEQAARDVSARRDVPAPIIDGVVQLLRERIEAVVEDG